MKKAEKIKFINEVYYKFTDAHNHGRGKNWWYPSPNVIAYNVKMYGTCKGIEDVREKMTKRQNEYYTDEDLYGEFDELRNSDRDALIADVQIEFEKVEGCWFAGRSGGWLEVQYTNSLEEVDENSEDIEYYYKEAKALDDEEGRVAEFVKDRILSLGKYEDSDEFVNDFVEILLDDETIGEVYKEKAHAILEKLA